VCQR